MTLESSKKKPGVYLSHNQQNIYEIANGFEFHSVVGAFCQVASLAANGLGTLCLSGFGARKEFHGLSNDLDRVI